MQGRNTAETVIAVSAIVTAVIALVVGVWENVQERRHNRLSVVPSLVYFLEVSRDAEQSDGKPAAVLRLVNQGMGPAIVQASRVVITRQNAETHSFPGLSEAAPALAELGVALGSRAELSAGTVVGAEQEVSLARFEFREAAPEDETYALVTDLLARFEYEIDYESIYGDTFQATLSR